jgi:gliding motility-associated-like protein
MKWLKILLIVIIQACSLSNTEIEKMAVRVPDTNTFSLQDVVNAVEDHAGDIPDNLDACFDNAIATYFDPIYHSDSYAVPNSLKRFRNYGPPTHEIFVPDGFSPNGDGVHDYFEVYNLEYYPVHKMSIFHRDGWLIYQRTNDYHLYPWDGKYNGNDMPEGSYQWVLEINGSPYDSGTVMISR